MTDPRDSEELDRVCGRLHRAAEQVLVDVAACSSVTVLPFHVFGGGAPHDTSVIGFSAIGLERFATEIHWSHSCGYAVAMGFGRIACNASSHGANGIDTDWSAAEQAARIMACHELAHARFNRDSSPPEWTTPDEYRDWIRNAFSNAGDAVHGRAGHHGDWWRLHVTLVARAINAGHDIDVGWLAGEAAQYGYGDVPAGDWLAAVESDPHWLHRSITSITAGTAPAFDSLLARVSPPAAEAA
jgi:hypothetical protein